MIPLTLDSGRVVELQDIMDAIPLDCMFVARACLVMRIKGHQSSTNNNKDHAVNFLQDFN